MEIKMLNKQEKPSYIYEKHVLSDYVVQNKKFSVIIPNKQIDDDEIFMCPSCTTAIKFPKIGSQKCACGLHYKSAGNALYLAIEID